MVRSFPRSLLLASAAVVLGSPAIRGALPSPPTPDGSVVLEKLDGTVERRELATFRVASPAEAGAAFLRFEGGSRWRPGRAERAELALAGGDRLVGGVLGGDGERLVVRVAGDVELQVSIDDLRRMEFPARIPEGAAAGLVGSDEGDRLYRRVGDSLDPIDGAVESFSLDGVRFDSLELGVVDVPWSELAVLVVVPFDDEPGDAEGRSNPVAVDLVDGGRLRAECRRIDSDGCRLALFGGDEVLFPPGAVAEVAVDDGTLTFLSSLPADERDEGSPFGDELGMTWPHRIDRSVTGLPLRAGGRLYTRGIGVQAPSRLVWRLDGGYRTLRGECAIDDQVLRLKGRGSVVFQIRVDGELAWESPVVRGGDLPVAFPPVDLTGAERLELEASMADDLHVADRADWLRMLLIR